MAPFYTSSPTVILPPHQNHYFGPSHLQQSPTELANSYFNRTNPASKSSSSMAGRKRSRDDDDDQESAPAAPVQPLVNRGEPTYGPGMTLVYPNDLSGSYNADASSQSGTWIETQTEVAVAQAQAQRPIVTSRKSQRLDSSAPKPNDTTALSQPDMRQSNTTEPLVDEITRLLGISWARMDGSEALSISQKAYTRWVQRHYPGLADVELWFENSSIPGYLGIATNKSFGGKEFLLWSQDLKQAVLVTREPSELIAKLMSPSAILGSATTSMFASDEPVADDNNRSPTPPITLPTAVPQVVAAAMDVD